MSSMLFAALIWIFFGGISYLIITNSKITEEFVQRLKNHPDSPVHSDARIRELLFSPGFLVLCLIFSLPIFCIVMPYELIKKLKGMAE